MMHRTLFGLCFVLVISGCALQQGAPKGGPSGVIPSPSITIAPPIAGTPSIEDHQKQGMSRCDALESQAQSAIAWFVHEGKIHAISCLHATQSCWQRLSNRFLKNKAAVASMDHLYQSHACQGNHLMSLSRKYFTVAAEEARACETIGVPACLSGSLANKVQYFHQQIQERTK